MQNQLIQTQQKQIGTKLLETISARGLHNFLGSKRDFSTWIKSRIAKYDFQENTDYLLHKIGEQLGSGTKYKIEYYITVNMAKELSMIENTQKGREARRYFIVCEEKLMEQKIVYNAHNMTIAQNVEQLIQDDQKYKEYASERGRQLQYLKELNIIKKESLQRILDFAQKELELF